MKTHSWDVSEFAWLWSPPRAAPETQRADAEASVEMKRPRRLPSQSGTTADSEGHQSDSWILVISLYTRAIRHPENLARWECGEMKVPGSWLGSLARLLGARGLLQECRAGFFSKPREACSFLLTPTGGGRKQ